jgi:hypothetical protein
MNMHLDFARGNALMKTMHATIIVSTLQVATDRDTDPYIRWPTDDEELQGLSISSSPILQEIPEWITTFQ